MALHKETKMLNKYKYITFAVTLSLLFCNIKTHLFLNCHDNFLWATLSALYLSF